MPRSGLEYPEGSLVDTFEASTVTWASKPALDFFGRRTTYRELG